MSTGETTSASEPLGVAVLGYGYWGPNLARNLEASELTRLVAICERDDAAAQRARSGHQNALVTTDWQQVLDSPDVAAVIVALPISVHHGFALDALRAGKHVLVEKPLAMTVEECLELEREAEARGLVLMAGHTFEYNAAVRRIGEYLDAGELGDPYYVAMRRTNLGIVRSDGNAMWSLAPHDISILFYWLKRDALSVSATGVAHLQPDIEDTVFMTINFDGGVLGHVHCSWLHPNKVREATVVCSKQMAFYDDVSAESKIRLYDKGIVKQGPEGESLGRYEDFGRFQMLARAGDIVIPKLDFREPLAVQTEHFAECVSSGARPLSDARSGRRVVAILEAGQRSLAADGTAEPVVGAPSFGGAGVA